MKRGLILVAVFGSTVVACWFIAPYVDEGRPWNAMQRHIYTLPRYAK